MGGLVKLCRCPVHPRYSECVLHTQSDDITMETTRSRTRTAGFVVPMVNPVTVPHPLWRDVDLYIAERRHNFRLQCAGYHQRVKKFCGAVCISETSATVITEVLRRSPAYGTGDEVDWSVVTTVSQIKLRRCRSRRQCSTRIVGGLQARTCRTHSARRQRISRCGDENVAQAGLREDIVMCVVHFETEILVRYDLRGEAVIMTVLEVIHQRVVVLAVEIVAGHREVDPPGRFHTGAGSHVIDMVGRFTGVGIAGRICVGGFPIEGVKVHVEPEYARRREHCAEQQTVLVPGQVVTGIDDVAVIEPPSRG